MKMKTLPVKSVLVILACAALTASGWAILNNPYTAPDWPESVSGLAFSPYQKNQHNLGGPQPSMDEINADLTLLATQTRSIRIYSNADAFFSIPRLASAHDLNVTVGAWLDTDAYTNDQEISRALQLAELDNVTRILIGNEVLLRKELSLEALLHHLDQVRALSDKPVSTAETWNTWIQYPQLADHVDFIAVHILPYWEGVNINQALEFTRARVNQLQALFPDKALLIAEVGWPSEGRTRSGAVPSGANQALFLRQFLELARQENYDYFLMEAFDQPWKQRDEGAVGAYWGIYDVERQAKFPFTGPIPLIPAWQTLVTIASALSVFILSLFYLSSHTLTTRGKTLLASIVYGLMTLVAWLIYDYATMYMSLSGIFTGCVLLLLMLMMVTLMLSETHEWIEAHWVSQHRRLLKLPMQHSDYQPMISIHVPAYNEPPEMLIQTLNALAKLDYDCYEVLVIDNNTKDAKVWQPVALHCEKLGNKFRFFHVDPLSGFKAGALNFALKQTTPGAEIVAVIDSDYIVEPGWLAELMPAFTEANIAIVQAPQAYRDADENLFKTMCNVEYQGFFEIGMVTRNERNAIIQHGTMTLIRREVLDQVGGWAEWSITEDAELGLRIFEQGYDAAYTSQSFGRGLIPDTFKDYKKQRHRWAYGSMQILKRHSKQLLNTNASQLTLGQRYHFISGWLPWMAQSASLVFSILALFWSAAMLISPENFEAPHLAFSIFPILFFCFNLLKQCHLYLFRLKLNFFKTLGASIAALSLSYTIGKAMLAGLFTSKQPFVRTPKKAKQHILSIATASSFEEILLFLMFVSAIFLLCTSAHPSSPDFSLWIVLLGIQCIPYAAALLMSLISARLMTSSIAGIGKAPKAAFEANTNK